MTMVESQVTIKKATVFTPELALRIRELAQMIGGNYKPLTDDDLKEMLATNNTSLFIAVDRFTGEITGMITLLINRIPYVRKASIEDLVVDEKYRGRGVGETLLRYALKYAQKKNVSYIDMTSRLHRIASNKMYQKIGFQKRETNVYRFIIDYAEV